MDDDANENRLLRYTIMSVTPDTTVGAGIGGFEMDVNTGTVRTTGNFDREMFAGPYSVTVSVACQITIPSSLPLTLPHSLPPSLTPSLPPQILVQDSGIPRRNGSTRLLVYLTDINDNNPIFGPGITLSLFVYLGYH